MRYLTGIVLSLLMGCTHHYHALRVTSTPSGQHIEVTSGQPVNMPSDQECLTPYEIIFPGDTSSWECEKSAKILVKFDDGSTQEKTIFFPHVDSVEVYKEPMLGLPILSKRTQTESVNREMHFDKRDKKESK